MLISPALAVPAERREAAHNMAERNEAEGLRCVADAILPKAFPEQHWSDERAKSEALARWHGADPEGYAAHYRAIIGAGVTGELSQLYCETLVLAGSDDPFNTPQSLEKLVKPVRNLRFETVEAGHFIAVQSPAKAAEPITRFVASAVQT